MPDAADRGGNRRFGQGWEVARSKMGGESCILNADFNCYGATFGQGHSRKERNAITGEVAQRIVQEDAQEDEQSGIKEGVSVVGNDPAHDAGKGNHRQTGHDFATGLVTFGVAPQEIED